MIKFKNITFIKITTEAFSQTLPISNGMSSVKNFHEIIKSFISEFSGRNSSFKRGQTLMQVVIFGSIAVYLLSAFVNWSAQSVKATRQSFNREQALQIAEAGIDYYRWRLAHFPTDFKDGTGGPGPYIHDFRDKDGNVIGKFELDITPPPVGSTLVTIASTGEADAAPGFSRTITVQLGKPSFAKYAVVSNSLIQFGAGTEVWGPVHSNGGISFNGVAMHNLVTSSIPPSGYDDPSHSGGFEWGVHTHVSPVDPLPPAPMPSHPVFMAGRQVGVPAVDFEGITLDLTQMKADAISAGRHYAGSTALGYHIVLKNTDMYDIYKVTGLVSQSSSCDVKIRYKNPTDSVCTTVTPNATWSINSGSETLVAGNVAFPGNGIIFAEDHVWIDGQVSTARLTVVAAVIGALPSAQKNIIINKNLLYTTYDGQDVIGLIAQNDIVIGLKSLDTQRVDAALIAQNGRLHRYNYSDPQCSSGSTRNQITFYGMFATYQRYALLTSASNCAQSGYTNRDFIYDPYLLYGAPPSFPLTSDQYTALTWEEG